MFPILRNVFYTATNILVSKSNLFISPFHLLRQPILNNCAGSGLLVPAVHNVYPNCGLKVMGKVRRRCKDCYFVRREERWYIMCKTHPRHKQMSMIKKPKNTWLLSHATQSKVRPW